MRIRWLNGVADKDYDAAYNFLRLLWDDSLAVYLENELREADLTSERCNDILRAAGYLFPLGRKDPGVRKELHRIEHGKKLSPVLLVKHEGGLEIADGFHRVSAIYRLNPDADIPCKLVDLAERAAYAQTSSRGLALVEEH